MLIIVCSVCSIFMSITATMLCLCWRKKTEKSVTLNNSRRSLPDIPLDGLQSVSTTVNYERNGDNSSDLYATVEPYNTAKRHTLPNGIDSRPSISQHSSISQADDSLSPYARVKDHPYAKLKTEHPYAHVQPSNSKSQEECGFQTNDSPSTARGERLSTSQSLVEPVASRSPRTSESIGIDIPAASAVAGGIAASQELPYMTPPIVQQNFSGDSQDSSKGYTSISVREPLANIRAQTQGLDKVQRDLDPHYSTVSDDSDDVYTTIQDPNNVIYTSESETYAQIQPPSLLAPVDGNANATDSSQREVEVNDQFDGVLRPVHMESRKNGINTHSRQASSSSSITNVGSPKPEKRQANSPLPPPPSSSSNSDVGSENLALLKTLDDMYAKVHKGKKRTDEESNQKDVECKETENVAPGKQTDSDVDLYSDHNYETLRKTSNPKYEKLKPKDGEAKCDLGYDVINAHESVLNSDPGYEAVKHGSEASSEEDPNYEELRHRTSSFADSAGYSTIGNKSGSNPDGYSVIHKNSEDANFKQLSVYDSDLSDLNTDEPNYESMPNETLPNHNYTLLNMEDTESDPNYESVSSNDPNYESVKFFDESTQDEPPYERLHDEDSSKTDSQRSSCDRLQSTQCVCEKDLQQCTNAQCLNNGYKRTVKQNPDTNSNVNVQNENDFDGIVQV
ncbi:uncharacterized protein LOC116181665 isoform X2 [Photinus pyralis]|uniref:Uncharacterized protein n=1 Tax=Photinus pyralis TaxID=7054 RepID=A0A1Y1LL57_PHOPY|nr:uncharacterized protein LOC116181665 isoform X2 [Photinus pyralis]